MSATKGKRSNDSSSSDDNEARFAEAVDPVFHGKLYGTNGNFLFEMAVMAVMPL